MLVTLLAVGCLSGASGCERSSGANGTAPAASPKPASLVSFPEALQAEDPEINAFIRRAIDICVTEDYEAFRLLWSALEEPLGEQEFRKGFRAARKVSILDLAARRTPDSEVVYLVHCLVELDPDQVPEPTRDIVLLLRKENDAWRVARPPSKEIRALKAKYARAREAMNATSNGVEIAGGSSQ
jgi:hypothetical protein